MKVAERKSGITRMIDLKSINLFSNEEFVIYKNIVTTVENISQSELPIEQFILKYKKWQTETNSEMFGIFVNDELVGDMSLAKQNIEEHVASVGYRVHPDQQRKGY